jgi:hypothetical protein
MSAFNDIVILGKASEETKGGAGLHTDGGCRLGNFWGAPHGC